ncbi:YitT family protein [Secundilactobacillus odoratitofui]|uniref:YitT family protein n=1 Tax=Secundilactobacillus odoratitofui TaxID=480930 RepID=UPI000A6CC53B
MKQIIRNSVLIMVGAVIYALAINYFLIPNRIGEGGVTGLTAIGYYTLKISPALTNLVLNGILMLVGWRYLNRQTVYYSLWAVLWISIFLKIPVFMPYQTSQTLIAAVTGGVLIGDFNGADFSSWRYNCW